MTAQTRDKIQVAVNDGTGPVIPGAVHRMNSRNLVAVFREDTDLDLEDGRGVQLIFTSTRTSSLSQVDATVRARTDKPPLRGYLFAFNQAFSVQEALGLNEVEANKRGTERSQTDQDGGLQASIIISKEVVPMLPTIPEGTDLKDGDLYVGVRIQDLSVSGFAAQVEPSDEVAFAASDRVRAEIRLSDGEQAITVPALIRNRQNRPSGVHYGFEFDTGSEEAVASHAKVVEFLAQLNDEASSGS